MARLQITEYEDLATDHSKNVAAPRPDLVQADLTNFISAVGQILFTFDSGAPTQRSYVYKLL